jgi:GTP-binding protein HflX
VLLPYEEGNLISIFHEQGQVERIENGPAGVMIQGRLPGRLLAQFASFSKHKTQDNTD